MIKDIKDQDTAPKLAKKLIRKLLNKKLGKFLHKYLLNVTGKENHITTGQMLGRGF